MFTFAICCLPSVCRLSVMLVRHTQPLEIFSNVSMALVPWPSFDIHGKFYGDRPRGTPPSGGGFKCKSLKCCDFEPIEGYSSKRCRIERNFVLVTNRKSFMSFRLVPKSVTLNDLERHNSPYFALFHRIR